MFSDDEVLSQFSDSHFLKTVIDASCDYLERASRLAANEHVSEIIKGALSREQVRRQLAAPEDFDAVRDNDDKEIDEPNLVQPEPSAETEDSTVVADSTTPVPPSVSLYDPAQVQVQLDGELPRSENALESLLQIMVTPGFERRELAVPAAGMAQACHALMSEFPNLRAASEVIAGAVSLAERHQLPIALPRLHIDGPPGCGKTQWLRRVADILRLPLVVISMSSVHGDFELAGCSRVYRGAEPGRLIKSLLTLKMANPIFLFDEAELGYPRHYGPLLSFLEDTWFADNFFEMQFRTEFVNKVFITNDAHLLLPAIQSRLSRIDVTQPTVDERREIVQRLYTNLRSENPLLKEFPAMLAAEIIESLSTEPLRDARKLLEAALYRAASRRMNDETLQLSIDDFDLRQSRKHFVFPAGHA